MSKAVEQLVNLRRWAVVGASNDHNKFGRMIFDRMRHAGYEVVPVHPKLTELDDGTPVFPSVEAIQPPVEVVDLVVPPGATAAVVAQAIQAGAKGVWFQPGSENEEAIAAAEAAGLAVVAHGPCAMVEMRRW